MKSHPNLSTAIVIGAGMAGLLAASVLSEHYREVHIIERDPLHAEAENRPGTPQAYHPHRLLPSGKMLPEKFFPGYTEELLAHGAFQRENKKIHLIHPYGSMEVADQYDAGCSRALLEWVIRRRVEQLPNVQFLTGHEVTGLLTTPDHNAVTGVYLRHRNQSGNPQNMNADLVVDTSGRSSKVVRWLEALGYPVAEPERLRVSLGYSTRRYKIPADLVEPASVILVEADPARGISGGAFGTIENNIAEIALCRAGGDSYPTTDGDQYEQEVAHLLSPLIAQELQKLEPLAEPRGYRVSECLRYHFEAMERWPAGFLVMGDAICNFDPIHGQGMTIVAIEADLLATALSEQQPVHHSNFEQLFLHNVQQALEPVWWLTLVADLRWQGAEYDGPVSRRGIAFAQRFFDLYLQEVYLRGNQELFMAYFMMTALLTPPSAVINRETVHALLAGNDSAEARQLREEFFPEGDDQLDDLLKQDIPFFAPLNLPMPAMLA